MRTLERFPAGGFFSGERQFVLRTLPPGARIRSVRFAIAPVSGDGDIGIDREELEFDAGDAAGRDPDDVERMTGAIKTVAASAPHWVEVAFEGRRIADLVNAVGLPGNNLADSTLQVDIGGIFVRVNDRGTIFANGDTDFTLADPDPNGAGLPAIATSRIRLLAPFPGGDGGSTSPIDLNRLHVRAVASNVRLSIGSVANAFVRPGELLSEVETPDLAEIVQIALDEAAANGTDDGSTEIPLTLAVDGTARLSLTAEIAFDTVAKPLGEELAEANLEFDVAGAPAAADDLLQLRVPAGMQLAANGTAVDLVGRFEGSEIVLGQLVERAAPGMVALSAGAALAQPFGLAAEAEIDALDLLVATTERRSRLELDLREDLDGKPSPESTLTQPVTLQITDARFATPAWASARLARAVTLANAGPEAERKRWWLVTQVLEGAVTLSVGEADVPDTVVPQATANGGLSWRAAEIAGTVAAPEQRFRLRRQTPAFKVPVTAEVGRGPEAERISLDDFQPLGRVDFTLGGTRIAGTANSVLGTVRATACPRGEQLQNGDFADRDQADGQYTPGGWISDGDQPRVEPLGSDVSPDAITTILLLRGERPSALSQLLIPHPGCDYELTVTGFAFGDDARAELIWRRGDCGVARVDELQPLSLGLIVDGGGSTAAPVAFAQLAAAFIPNSRLRVRAPADATGLELRLLALDNTIFVIDAVSLQASPTGLANADFLELETLANAEPGSNPPISGWEIGPPDARLSVAPVNNDQEDASLRLDFTTGNPRFTNTDRDRRVISLTQSVAAVADADVVLALGARSELNGTTQPPKVLLAWTDAAGVPLGKELSAEVVGAGGGLTRLGAATPAGATELSVRIELPPDTSLEVTAVTLSQGAVTALPLSFLSEAPGSLTIRDFSVAFEPSPQPSPETPEGGLCQPTPADRAPDDACEADPSCKCAKPTEQLVRTTATVSTVRPAAAVTFNARTRLAAERRVLTQRVDRTLDRRVIITAAEVIDRPPSLTEVRDIGGARATALGKIGIMSARHLSLADPAVLTRKLGFTPQLAARVVENARIALAQRRRS